MRGEAGEAACARRLIIPPILCCICRNSAAKSRAGAASHAALNIVAVAAALASVFHSPEYDVPVVFCQGSERAALPQFEFPPATQKRSATPLMASGAIGPEPESPRAPRIVRVRWKAALPPAIRGGPLEP